MTGRRDRDLRDNTSHGARVPLEPMPPRTIPGRIHRVSPLCRSEKDAPPGAIVAGAAAPMAVATLAIPAVDPIRAPRTPTRAAFVPDHFARDATLTLVPRAREVDTG